MTGVLRCFLAPFALLFWAAVSVRNRLYDLGLLKSTQVEETVFSVGNLTAGGSGKTPLTLELAKTLRRMGQDRLAVLSRGYGRRTRGPQVVSDGRQVLLDASAGGDEPVMMAGKLPGVPFVVAEARAGGVALARERFGSRLVLLDDGFQHRALARDLDIVLLDVSAPAWHWQPLPAGRLREGAGALARADVVVLTGNASRTRYQQVEAWLRRWSDGLVLWGRARGERLVPLDGGEPFPMAWLRGRPVGAACAIARPDRFKNTLQELAAEVVVWHPRSDHGRFSDEWAGELLDRASSAGAEALVITAKDAVKWPEGLGHSLPVLVLEQSWHWDKGFMDFRALLEKRMENSRR